MFLFTRKNLIHNRKTKNPSAVLLLVKICPTKPFITKLNWCNIPFNTTATYTSRMGVSVGVGTCARADSKDDPYNWMRNFYSLAIQRMTRERRKTIVWT
jgi:hypothetical protein